MQPRNRYSSVQRFNALTPRRSRLVAAAAAIAGPTLWAITSVAQTSSPVPTDPASETAEVVEPQPPAEEPKAQAAETAPAIVEPESPAAKPEPSAVEPEPSPARAAEPALPASDPEPAVEAGPPEAAAAPAESPRIFEPPLPQAAALPDVPPRPPVDHLAPSRALFASARAGWQFPAGSLWRDGRVVRGVCCLSEARAYTDFASSGPALELNLGGRFSRRYTVFGIWEYATFGAGKLEDEFGGQERGSSHFAGVGARFETDPDGLSFVVELALGWRRFQATWQNGTELTATDSLINSRIGLGVSYRLSADLSLSATANFGAGLFSDIEWKFADGTRADALSPFDTESQHTPVSLSVGAHFDAFGAD